MPWVKVPPENQPKFLAALPKDPRLETRKIVERAKGLLQTNYLSNNDVVVQTATSSFNQVERSHCPIHEKPTISFYNRLHN